MPFPESSLNDEAGKLFMESYDEYARRARLLTAVHAQALVNPDRKMPAAASSCTIPSSEGSAREEDSVSILIFEKMLLGNNETGHWILQYDVSSFLSLGVVNKSLTTTT